MCEENTGLHGLSNMEMDDNSRPAHVVCHQNSPTSVGAVCSEAHDLPELLAPTLQQRLDAVVRLEAIRDHYKFPKPPVVRSSILDDISQTKLYVALENLNPYSHSIKDRAAILVLPAYPPGERLIIASTGNHAIAYAEVGKGNRNPPLVVVPQKSSDGKVARLRELGADVIYHGNMWEAAQKYAARLAQEKRGILTHFALPNSVAALGTAVYDMLVQRPLADAVILPGGGGTIASAAQMVREFEKFTHRKILVLIACPAGASTIYESFKYGQPLTIPANTVADAMNVGTVDRHLLPKIIAYADDVVAVDEGWIMPGAALLASTFDTMVEAAGAVSPMAVIGFSGILRGATGKEYDLRGKEVLTMISGGNLS
jgi:threonine dehydratase